MSARRWQWDETMQLRIASVLEGTSNLALVLVGVPLKHLADMPAATSVLGRIHGALVILFVVTLVRCAGRSDWSLRRVLLYAAVGLLPGGGFFVERRARLDPR